MGSEKSGRLFNVNDTKIQAKHKTATAMSMSHGLLASNLKYQFIFEHKQILGFGVEVVVIVSFLLTKKGPLS